MSQFSETYQKNKNIKNKFFNRKVLKGISVVPGLDIGIVCNYKDILKRQQDTTYLDDIEIIAEIKRFRKALKLSKKNLAQVKEHINNKVNNKSSEIFLFQQLTLEDKALIYEIESEIKNRKVNAEAVVRGVLGRRESIFRKSQSLLIQQRANDIRDILRFLLRALLDTSTKFPKSNNKKRLVIFAEQLVPSDAIHFDSKKVAGIVTMKGGQYSHTALLARENSIPFVTGINLKKIHPMEGSNAIVVSDKGQIILNPSENELELTRNEIKIRKESLAKIVRKTKYVDLNYNGREIKVLANIFGPADIKTAHKYGAYGIGLYRIEGIYIDLPEIPSSDQIYNILNTSLVPFRDKPITLRLLDTGADKAISVLNLENTNFNPFGIRGIRLLLKHKNILNMQISAFLRLSQKYEIKILIPLVTTIEEIKEVQNLVEEERNKLIMRKISVNKMPQIGAMVETPAAVAVIDKIIKKADFINIGTNDLIQYTMAVDRDDINLRYYYEKGEKLILPMVRNIINKCNDANIECSLCGEIAGNCTYTQKLLTFGLQQFSVPASVVPYVKNKILAVSSQ